MFSHQRTIWTTTISENPYALDTIPLTAGGESQLAHQPELLLTGLSALRWSDPDHQPSA
jgi:hypothetical protein